MVWYRLNNCHTANLIALVKKNSCLWDHNNPDFKKTSQNRSIWLEIGKDFNLTGNEARNKWKNLKDKFRKELHIESQKKMNAAAPNSQRKWKFYKEMSFLKDILLHSGPYGNPSICPHGCAETVIANPSPAASAAPEPQENNDLDESSNIEIDNNSGEDSVEDNLEPIIISTRSLNPQCDPLNSADLNKKHKPNIVVVSEHKGLEEISIVSESVNQVQKDTNSNAGHVTIAKSSDANPLEDRQLNASSSNENNFEISADQHFLLSLLPYIGPLDPLQKLELRSAMQKLVLESYKEHKHKNFGDSN